jgi:uncharacterized protein
MTERPVQLIWSHMKLEIHGQKATLLPQHALYLDDLNILAIADVHIGKPEVFQQHGMWVPSELNKEDLGRISRLVKELQPESLYIIGDFIHDVKGLTPDLMEEILAWRNELDCSVVWLEGNHDRRVQPHMLEWSMVSAQSMTIENFVFSHEPSKPDKPGQIVVSGHVHPTIVLETDQDRLRLPCFVWEESQMILPSFGSFTGGADVQRHSNGRYFSVTGGEVIEV